MRISGRPLARSSKTRSGTISRSHLSGALMLLLSTVGTTAGRAQDLQAAEQHLLQGRADQAAAEARAVLAHAPANGAAHLLLCRIFLSTLHGNEAAAECRLALQSGLDRDTTAQDWAGRAFGMEADHAGPIAGLKLANQVRAAFDTAYHLNPRNPAAASDLGEYFVHAPFLVGGGTDKALTLSDSLQASLPQIAHRLRALVAEKHENTTLAEREFLAATQNSQSPGSFVDLATFYTRQGDPAKAAAAARRAVQQDHAIDANVVEAASVLNDAHQTAQATQVLHAYLEHGQQSDQAPVFRAHTLLGEILASQGDRVGARREFIAALALASDYGPARKDLDKL